MNIIWNHRNESWPKATRDLRDYIYIVSDGKQMTIARWVDLCFEDPNCGADQDEFDFLPVKEMEIIYWYGPVCQPITDISEYQPERSKREDPKGMRCSELYGNIETLAEMTSAPR